MNRPSFIALFSRFARQYFAAGRRVVRMCSILKLKRKKRKISPHPLTKISYHRDPAES